MSQGFEGQMVIPDGSKRTRASSKIFFDSWLVWSVYICLINGFREFSLVDDKELKSMIDQGLVTLIKRGFGVRPPEEREEREVQSRINDSGSLDNQRMR